MWRYKPGSGMLPHKLNTRVTTLISQCKELENVLSFQEVLEEAPRGVCCKPHLKVLALTCAGSVLWGGFCWAVGTVGIDMDELVYEI